MMSLCNAHHLLSYVYVSDEIASVCLLTLQNTCSGTSYPSADRKAHWKLPTMWGARGDLSELSWVKPQSELVDRNRCLRNTLIKSDILISLFAVPKDSEDSKNEFPETSWMPCTSGGVCPGKADRLTVPSRAKFPSGTKICCSCPVYTNNLLSGARTCPSATFYHLTEEGIHSVKYSLQALAITKQPDSVRA